MSGSNALLDAIAHPPQVNLLADYQGAANTANAMWQNRLWQAQQQAGQIAQRSMNPDGTQNQALLNQGLAAGGPGVALAAQHTSQAGLTNATGEQDMAMKRTNFINAQLPSLLTLPDDKLHDGLVDTMNRGRAMGIGTPETNLKIMSALSNDPTVLRQQLERVRIANQPPEQQQASIYGTRPQINTGGSTQFPIVPSVASGQPAPVVPNTTSPEQKISPVAGPSGPTGGPTTISTAEYAQQRGLDPNTGNPLPHPAFAGLPSALRNPNAPPPAAIPPTPTGVGPGTSAALTETGGTSSKAYEATSQAGVKAITRRAQLQTMLAEAPEVNTGPLAGKFKDMQATIQQVAPRVASMFGIDPDKVAKAEDIYKLGNQISDAQGAASDSRLLVTQGSNPSQYNTPAGLQLIVRKAIGNDDYAAARAQLASQYQHTQDPTSDHNRDFETKVGAQLDPRVFQFNRLNADQQKQYLSEMPQAAKDKFKLDYNRHKSMGILPSG
jgi:hypothetical protein